MKKIQKTSFVGLIISALFLSACSEQHLWPAGDPVNQASPVVGRTIATLNSELSQLRNSVVILNEQIIRLSQQRTEQSVAVEAPFITIVFSDITPNYLPDLRTATAQALSVKKDVRFIVKSIATISANVPNRERADIKARELAWQIQQDLLSFGINPRNITIEPTVNPALSNDEVRLYVR